MNNKELYIQYLEDALNNAKTGEPMKHWQLRYGTGGWIDKQRIVRDNLEKMSTGRLSIRIKPEPFKWTTVAYRTAGGIGAWVKINGHYTREELSNHTGVTPENILAIHHHEIEID